MKTGSSPISFHKEKMVGRGPVRSIISYLNKLCSKFEAQIGPRVGDVNEAYPGVHLPLVAWGHGVGTLQAKSNLAPASEKKTDLKHR